MWKGFIKADRGVDFVSRYGAMYTVTSAALSWLAKSLPWWGNLSWPEAVAIGLAAGLVLLFILSITGLCAAIAWRKFKPGSTEELIDDSGESAVEKYDVIMQIISNRTSEINSLTQVSAAQSDHICNMQKSLEKIQIYLGDLKSDIACASTITDNILIDHRNEAIDLIKTDLKHLEDQIEASASSQDFFLRAKIIPTIEGGIFQKLVALGVSGDDLRAKLAARSEAVKTDTDFVVLRDAENERWSGPAEKKDYYSRRVSLDVFTGAIPFARSISGAELIAKVDQAKQRAKNEPFPL